MPPHPAGASSSRPSCRAARAAASNRRLVHAGDDLHLPELLRQHECTFPRKVFLSLAAALPGSRGDAQQRGDGSVGVYGLQDAQGFRVRQAHGISAGAAAALMPKAIASPCRNRP